MVAPLFAFLFAFAVAGDMAPQIDWTKIVQSPESARFQPGLTGQYTVLQFLPVTPNAQAVDDWNKTIEQFRDQPVQFIWITAEDGVLVKTFLREHPMNGWLLIDEEKEVEQAYGEMGGDVIVDPSGKIVGFTTFLAPEQLTGVLNGKAKLETEPPGRELPDMPHKPDIAPSYEVHISPSKTNGTEGSSGPDFWVQRGFDLRTIVSMVYEKDLSAVVVPESLSDGRFDFVVVLPKEEDEHAIHQLVARAIEKHFGVSATVERKPTDVYVMTALEGRTPQAKKPDAGFSGFVGSSGFEFALPEGSPSSPEARQKAIEELLKHPENIGLANISAGNTTMDEFRQNLETGLGRPVIDETGLGGVYDIEVKGNAKNTDEFIRMLREQTGLVLTPANRSIEILTVRTLN